MTWKSGFSPSSAQADDSEKVMDAISAGRLPKGHKQTFTYSLYMVSTHLLGTLLVPTWVLTLTKKLRDIGRSFVELQAKSTLPFRVDWTDG